MMDGQTKSRIISRPDLPARVVVFETGCKSFGLPIHPESPIGKRLGALRKFASASKPIPKDTSFFPLVGEALWLTDIFERLAGEICKKDHCKRLGSHRTFDSVYVELLAACMIKMGGGQAELMGADLRAVIDGVLISVACKRVTSLKKLIPRCREARDQIIQHGLPGIVWIDISPLLLAKSNWSYEDVKMENRRLLRPFLHQIREHLIGLPLLRALLFMNQHFAITLEADQQGSPFYRGNTLLHFGKVDLAPSREAEALADCLEKALDS